MSCCGAPETSASASSPRGRKASRSISRASAADRPLAGRRLLDEPGAPLLAGAVGWLRGHVLAEHPAGTHTFFVGEIDSADPGPSDRPLAYFGHAYHGL